MWKGGLVALIALAGCGRISFDAVGISGDAIDGTGSPSAASCIGLANTCGPLGASSCCESPVVTGGTFYRGYDMANDGLYPDMSYPATVSRFRLDKYEVTVGRFRQFVNAGMGTRQSPPAAGAGGRALNGMADQGGWDASWNASLVADTAALVASITCNTQYQTWTDAPGGNENRPMTCITWYEAMAFCAWDGGFLPTEAEWNYAAAGGSEQRAYPWSSPPSLLTLDDSTYASYYVDATKECMGDGAMGCAVTDLVPVGTKPAGNGAWGQSDLGGNVWEWTLDFGAGSYPNPCTDCANLTPATGRMLRGGSFLYGAPLLRTGYRDPVTASDVFPNVSVRCARTP